MIKLLAFLIGIAQAQVAVNPNSYLVFATPALAQARSQQQCQALACVGGTMTASISGNVLTVTAITGGPILCGQPIFDTSGNGLGTITGTSDQCTAIWQNRLAGGAVGSYPITPNGNVTSEAMTYATDKWWNVVTLTNEQGAVEIQPSGAFSATTTMPACAVGCGLTPTEQSQLQTAAQLGSKLPSNTATQTTASPSP